MTRSVFCSYSPKNGIAVIIFAVAAALSSPSRGRKDRLAYLTTVPRRALRSRLGASMICCTAS